MVNDLNKTLQMGYLGADAKQQSTTAPVTFSIATSEKWTDENNQPQERTEWHNIVVFGNLRNYAIKFKKGDRVFVEGKIHNNKYPKEIGGETVTMIYPEIHAVEIDRVAAKGEESSPESETTSDKRSAGKGKK
ncbi:MAG TPA: single-stranded DNA-binding protein [Edaphobacter sp.]|nr:single-stranded DNA-binding protein [Edaphobacter sp.]